MRQKRIAIVVLENGRTKEDFDNYTSQFWPQIEQQPHSVDIIVDSRAAKALPAQPITRLIWLAKNRPANARYVVFIVRLTLALAVVRALNQAISPLYPKFRLYGVLSQDEAIRLLTALNRDTAESRG